MEIKDKLEMIFMLLVVLLFGCVILLTIKLSGAYKRINKLENDYKIYKINLSNLEKNKEVQFKK